MKTAPKLFRANFYVRFYYTSGCDMAKRWGEGPFYAACDTLEGAEQHKTKTLEQLDYVERIQILTKMELNEEEGA